MFTGFVINLNCHVERLYQFNQHTDAKYFKRIPAVDKQILSLLETQFLFDLPKLEQQIKRPVTPGEIGCTLSHIIAWQNFSQMHNNEPNDYAVIAEDDIQLCIGFSKKIAQITDYLKKTNSQFNIVLLHKLGLYQQYTTSDEQTTQYKITSITEKTQIDNDGSALYLIKKSYAQYLVNKLISQKPYWLADHFSIFGGDNIGLIQPFLGKISPDTKSYLEEDREQARKTRLK